MKKSQASVEFLTTYAWAFIVIVTVISAFLYFNVTNPKDSLPERCSFSPEIGCLDALIESDGVNIQLKNNLGDPIKITEVILTTEKSAIITCDSPTNDVGEDLNNINWNSDDKNFVKLSNCNFNALGINPGTQKLLVDLKYYKLKSGPEFTVSASGELIVQIKPTTTLPPPKICGDGLIHSPNEDEPPINEECDTNNYGGEDCDSQLPGSVGSLTCTAGCLIDSTGCTIPTY